MDLEQRLSSVISELQSVNSQIASHDRKTDTAIQENIDSQRSQYNKSKQEKVRKLNEFIDSKKAECLDLIKVPSREPICEVHLIEDVLHSLLPSELISNYEADYKKNFKSDSDAFKLYTKTLDKASALSKGSRILKFFLSDKTENFTNNSIAGKGIAVLTVVILLKPEFYLLLISLSALLAYMEGKKIKEVLDNLSSVKDYVNATYDTEAFASEAAKAERYVVNFFEDLRKSKLSEINSNEFKIDSSTVEAIKRRMASLKERLLKDKEKLEKTIESLRTEIERQKDEIERRRKEKEERTNKIIQEAYEITWGNEWLNSIVLGVTPYFDIISTENVKGNVIYTAKSIEPLQQFCKDYAMQCAVKMHPDMSTSLIIDHKYMGGSLIDLSNLDKKILRLEYIAERADEEYSKLSNNIIERTGSAIATTGDIENYNNIMRSYDSVGLNYIIVHIFGLNKLNEALNNALRSGPRAGYFFKIYLTTEELKFIYKDLDRLVISKVGIVSDSVKLGGFNLLDNLVK